MSTDRSVAEVTNILKEFAKNISRQNEILASIDKNLAKLAALKNEELHSIMAPPEENVKSEDFYERNFPDRFV